MLTTQIRLINEVIILIHSNTFQQYLDGFIILFFIQCTWVMLVVVAFSIWMKMYQGNLMKMQQHWSCQIPEMSRLSNQYNMLHLFALSLFPY